MLKKNLIANYLGQGWVGLIGLAFIPLYIKYLGIEAYGLIGLFALLQAWLSLLEIGITPLLGREMARFTGGGLSIQHIRDLLRSLEIIAIMIAVIIAVGIWLCSNWITSSWLQVETLPNEVVSNAFELMGLVTAIRFIESVYRSSLVGLQRQVLFNMVNSVMATFRAVGAVVVLVWVSASIEAFFIWQVLISMATLIILVVATYAGLSTSMRAGRFMLETLSGVWRFSGGMIGITFLGLLLTQVDKILLSNLLSLTEYGYYTLASVMAGSLYMVISPITQAFYPRFCELYVQNDKAALIDALHKGAQLVTVFAGSIAIVVTLFAKIIIRLWTQDSELSQRTDTLLSLLMMGNLLNGLMWIPYQIQLAHGLTNLMVRMNVVAVAVFVPAILWATSRFGVEGAAWIWLALNACYVFIGIHFMYLRILNTEKWSWYKQDVFYPLAAGSTAASVLKLFWVFDESNVTDTAQLVLTFVITLTAMLLSASRLRDLLQSRVFSYIDKWKIT